MIQGKRDQGYTVGDNSRGSNRVAAVFLLRADGALLMQRRDNKPGLPLAGMWAPPGGHCEDGESIIACARREFREETGYDCADLNMLGSFIDDHVRNHPPYPLTVFWSKYDGLQAVQCFEGEAMEFIQRERASSFEIPSYLLAIWDQAIAALRERDKDR